MFTTLEVESHKKVTFKYGQIYDSQNDSLRNTPDKNNKKKCEEEQSCEEPKHQVKNWSPRKKVQ